MAQKKKMSKEKLLENNITFDETNNIRNHNRGWVFSREDMTIPDNINKTAISAIKALGLDFGAVDIAYNEYYNKLKVFEVNTAVGMESGTTTHMRYTAAISKAAGREVSKEEYCAKYNCELNHNII